jgi:nucleoid-associated protein YgaU
MRRSTIIISALIVLGLVAAALPAQSLLDNEFYRKAQELKAQSDAALTAGDYDQATSLAAQVKEYLVKSDEYVVRALGFYRANGWLQIGTDRLAQAKAAGADTYAKELYDTAAADLDQAKASLDGGTYDDSIDFSKRAIATLDQIPAKEPARTVTTTTTTVEPMVTIEPATPALPVTYTVRLIIERRDCFWRIAEYAFIYNDPWKWKVLYEANKHLLTDPNNPDLIEPGQVFTIPSIAGETREGAYDPELSYPTFTGN